MYTGCPCMSMGAEANAISVPPGEYARKDSGGTAGDKPEEGGDDVKSSWPLCPGLHTCYNGRYRVKRSSDVEQNA